MDSSKYNFLSAVLGEEGAKALSKAADRSQDLEAAILPRAVVAWLEGAPGSFYEGSVPGVDNTYLTFHKSESGYTGNVSIGDEIYKFESAPLIHVASAIAVSLGVYNERVSPAVRDLDLVRLGKNLDLLVKARNLAEEIAKEKLVGGKGDKKKDSDFDADQVAAGVREEHEEHGGPVSVAHEIAHDHLTEDPKYYKKLSKGYYDASGLPVDEVIRRWKERGDKAYDDSRSGGAYMVPIEQVLPHREYHWSRDYHRGGAVPNYRQDAPEGSQRSWSHMAPTFGGEHHEEGYENDPEFKSGNRWDALVQYMKENGWKKDPGHLMIGSDGSVKLGEGNHRVAIAQQVGLTHVPIMYHFGEGQVKKNPMGPDPSKWKKSEFEALDKAKGHEPQGQSAKPLAPVEPAAPQPTQSAGIKRNKPQGAASPTASSGIPSSKPKMSKSIKITKAQSERKCSICGGHQFSRDVFTGCLCFNDLAKSVVTKRSTDDKHYVDLSFGSDWDRDSILTLIEAFGGI